VLDGACKPIGDGGCWEAMRLWEMHQDIAVIGGRILDTSGRIIESCITWEGVSYEGLLRGDPGPFAMALKPQTVARIPGLFFFCRSDLLRTAVAGMGGDPGSGSFAEHLSELARERKLCAAYSPLIEAVRVLDE
jgi:O-antigen biosynthesis protein